MGAKQLLRGQVPVEISDTLGGWPRKVTHSKLSQRLIK